MDRRTLIYEAGALTAKKTLSYGTYIVQWVWHAGSRWPGGNALASDASDPASTPGLGSLELDTVYHPFGIGEMYGN